MVKEPIFICAGEPSGDLYAGLLVKELKKNNPNLRVYGIGGAEMQKSGVEVRKNYQGLGTFGFSAGIFSILKNYKIYQEIGKEMYRIRPKTFIALAYPGINLLLCKYAKKLGCRVYYFLPPQIWAWGVFRKYFIKKWVDKVISVFPFECEFYKKQGIRTAYVENPLFEKLKKYNRNDFNKRIGFMPGSRLSQIKRNLPLMIGLMKKISKNKDAIEFDLILYSNSLELTKEVAMTEEGGLKSPAPPFKIITEERYQVMKNCDLLITSSGTASFEAAIMNIPQIFFNRPSFFDYYIFRRFLKTREYNLANLYFNKKIVPSFVSFNKNYILQNLFASLLSHLGLGYPSV